jgi:hypothetical protein
MMAGVDMPLRLASMSIGIDVCSHPRAGAVAKGEAAFDGVLCGRAE